VSGGSRRAISFQEKTKLEALMVRTQIQLTEERAKRLRELSAASRRSVAALIRKAVDQFLASANPDRSALSRTVTQR